MSVLTLDDVRHETRLAIRISTRDVGKRLAGLSMALALCWAAGERAPALATLALVLVCEVSAQLAARADPQGRDAPLWLVAWMWLTNVPSTLFFLLPALILAAQPEAPLVLAGFLWMFGVYVHVSNSFVLLPFYNWCQMAAAFAAGAGVVAVAAGRPEAAGEGWLWLCVGGLFVAYAVNTVGTMTTQKDFWRELRDAREEARLRLVELGHLARHDRLTGLLNRQAFDEELERLLGRRSGRLACLLIDLDGFKAVNDAYSHAAGDAVLAACAERLRRLAGPGGLAARLGGDEFALAIPGLPGGEAALDVARAAARDLAAPVSHAGTEFRVGGSVGVALDGADGEGPAAVASLCARADQAMFRAKAAARAGGERRPVLWEAASFPPRPSPEDRRRLEAALAGRQVRPAYLPVVDLETGALGGFEAMARWSHPGALDLRPETFMPLIRDFGLGGELFAAMAEQVAAEVAGLVAEGLDPGRVSFDVPGAALATHGGREALNRALRAHPAARTHLAVEFGEDALALRAADALMAATAAARGEGLGASLDGFGVGAGSFCHLRRLDVDEVKLAPALVADLGSDPAAGLVLEALVGMARGLGARLVACGVDTEEARRALLRLGCRWGQGRLLGRPLPLPEARARLLAAAGAGGPAARAG